MFHVLAVLIPLFTPVQYYTSHGSMGSDPGDLMYRQPDGLSQNVTQDEEDDARDRALSQSQPANPEWAPITSGYDTPGKW